MGDPATDKKEIKLYATQFDIGVVAFKDGRKQPALRLQLEDGVTEVYGLFEDRNDMLRLYKMLDKFLFTLVTELDGYA